MNPLPDGAKNVVPKLLAGAEVKLADSEPHRPALVKWATDKTNPFFAKAFVNRAWSWFYGRGLVSPVDDLDNDENPASPSRTAVQVGRRVRRQRLRREAARPGHLRQPRRTSGRACRPRPRRTTTRS